MKPITINDILSSLNKNNTQEVTRDANSTLIDGPVNYIPARLKNAAVRKYVVATEDIIDDSDISRETTSKTGVEKALDQKQVNDILYANIPKIVGLTLVQYKDLVDNDNILSDVIYLIGDNLSYHYDALSPGGWSGFEIPQKDPSAEL